MKVEQPDSSLGKALMPKRAALLVEDEELLRVAVATLLRKNGFLVLEAENGRAAIDLFRDAHSQIAVVILDLVLPGLSGSEVLKELRRIQPSIKVILTTAYSPEVVRAFIDGRQTWRFAQKPYRVGDLVEIIREVLDT